MPEGRTAPLSFTVDKLRDEEEVFVLVNELQTTSHSAAFKSAISVSLGPIAVSGQLICPSTGPLRLESSFLSPT